MTISQRTFSVWNLQDLSYIYIQICLKSPTTTRTDKCTKLYTEKCEIVSLFFSVSIKYLLSIIFQNSIKFHISHTMFALIPIFFYHNKAIEILLKLVLNTNQSFYLSHMSINQKLVMKVLF